jgi:hypothetical protein
MRSNPLPRVAAGPRFVTSPYCDCRGTKLSERRSKIFHLITTSVSHINDDVNDTFIGNNIQFTIQSDILKQFHVCFIQPLEWKKTA